MALLPMPALGAIVLAGALHFITITPTVSTARELVAVPDVVGSPQSDAIFAITTAGLRVGSTTRAMDPAVPAGAVIATSPETGRLVAAGTSVALVVSSGPEVSTPTASPAASPTATTSASPDASNTPQPSVLPSQDPNGSPSRAPDASPDATPAPP